MTPESYITAAWRNTLPRDPKKNTVGIGFFHETLGLLRIALDIPSATHLMETLQESLETKPKHFGIWCQDVVLDGITIRADGWLMGANGILFWTTSRAVAEAQLVVRKPEKQNREVREFKEAT